MKTIYVWLIYNIAVLITTIFLVHYLGWIGLAGFFAISSSYTGKTIN